MCTMKIGDIVKVECEGWEDRIFEIIFVSVGSSYGLPPMFSLWEIYDKNQTPIRPRNCPIVSDRVSLSYAYPFRWPLMIYK